MSNQDLEARYAALSERVTEAHGELHLSATVGGVDVTAEYNITPLRDDAETLAAQMDTIERLVDDPRFAEAGRMTLIRREVEALVADVNEIARRRADDYNLAIAALKQFAIGEGEPVEMEVRQTITDIFRRLVDEAIEAREAEQANKPDEPSEPSEPPF